MTTTAPQRLYIPSLGTMRRYEGAWTREDMKEKA